MEQVITKEGNLYRLGDKLWALPRVDEPIRFKLIRRLGDNWSHQDVHEVAQMVESNPIIKQLVVELLDK